MLAPALEGAKGGARVLPTGRQSRLASARGPLPLLVLFALIAAAILGNVNHLTLFYRVDVLFGSIAVLIVLRLYGLIWGVLAAALAGSYTVLLWDHPYGLLVFTLEALVVGLLLRTPRISLLLSDGAFWLFLGMPLVWVCYTVLMDLGVTTGTLVALKEGLNGIANALLASLLIHYLPLGPWLQRPKAIPRVSLQETLFDLTVAFVVLPALLLVAVHGRSQRTELEAILRAELESCTVDIAQSVGKWLEQHRHAVASLARQAQARGVARSAELQHDTALIQRAFPDFHAMYVADAGATTITFSPPVNERGESTIGLNFSDRDYYKQLKQTLQPVMSDVFMGRGGVFTPIATVAAPIVDGGAFRGFAIGALDLRLMANMLRSHKHGAAERISLLDRHGLVIASTDPALAPQREFRHRVDGFEQDRRGETYRWVASDPEVPAIVRWRDSFYVRESPVADDVPWKLVVEAPIAPLQTQLTKTYLRALAITLAFAVGALLVAAIVSRWLTRPIARLAAITRDLPRRMREHGEPAWPSGGTSEMRALVSNTRSMSASLRKSFDELTARSADLEQANRALHDQITERERLEQEVRQKQKMEAVGRLAGGIAHDFNNILTAIMGYVELVRDQHGLDADAASQLDEVLVATRRARDLVRQILAFSRPRPAKRELVSLGPIVEDALKLLRATLPASIELIASTAASQSLVAVDATQVYQVVMNLCANAERSMRESGGLLEVRLDEIRADQIALATETPLEAGEYVRLSVRDTGSGIPREHIDKIFDPFFTTRQTGEGTGMGLAVVHGIVSSHGGALAVRSVLGEGTTIEVLLPVAPRDATATLSTLSEQPAPAHAGTESVLLVDDEPGLARLGRLMLEGMGYRVTAVDSSSDALRRLRSEPDGFDLVVTDQTMPGMTGDELIAAIHRVRPDLPVVLCTGFSHKIDPEQTEALGIDALLTKPYGRDDLAAAVRRALEARATREGAAKRAGMD
ncbi:MAG: response regulator [Acidobacteriota bacterium]|nr:MAG: response regulator [Acidobacteriota bacterium]